ncbi:MAG: VanZ family protein [Candidatus Aegiribacteria sp.]|nr:VanZ family protein [Candidatus Aegiribacteria sp.]
MKARFLLQAAAKRGFLLFMLGGIFYLSHQPSLKVIPPLFTHQDKVLHAGMYFLLSISMIVNRDLCRRFYPVTVMFVSGIIYAISDEIHQSFIPGRDCSAGDLLADIAGLALGLSLYLWYRKEFKKNG